ncbi:unnamed protein product, partial [marine sediment metagenome]
AVMPADHIAAYMRAAIDKGNVKTIKNVEVEQIPPKEKPKARVGDPPRKTPPKQAKVEPKPEKSPKGPPKSLDDLTARIASFLPGHSELVVISDRVYYYRVEKKRTLDKEIENHVDFIVSEMGGEWHNESNEWRILKEA